MHILKLEIESFGKLSDFVLEPARGITLIEGENESGKSTILAFLRFIWYGFPRKNAADGDERERRLSWQSRTAAGRLTFAWQGGSYRIVRRCIARNTATRETVSEELSVIALSNGAEVPMDGKTPGEYFLGLPAELYDGSLSLVQSGADRVCAEGMGEAVGELLLGDEALLSAEAAIERLQTARRSLRHAKGRGGRIAELEDELALLDGELSAAREEWVRIADAQAESKRHQDALSEKKRAFACVTEALAGAETDRALALFDDLHSAREEEMRCRATLERIGTKGAAELPDKEALGRMTEAAERLGEVERMAERLAAEAERLAAIRHNERLLQGAKMLVELGEHAEKVPERVAKKTKRAKVRGVLSVFCLLLCGGALAGSYFLLQYAKWLGLAAALLLAFGVIFLCGSIGARRSGKKILKRFGAQDATMFRTYLEQCKREADSFAAHTAHANEVKAHQLALDAERDGALTVLREVFAEIGREPASYAEQDVRACLAELVQKRSALQSAMAEATGALERAVGAREALERRVVGMDEQALRARRATVTGNAMAPAELYHKKELLQREVAALEQSCAEAARRESALLAVARDPDGLTVRRRETAAELERAELRLAAIRMATDVMGEAAEEMRAQITPRLSARAAATFDKLTEGAHGALRVADGLGITLEGDGIPRPLSHFSAGCRDAAHLSLRLALLEEVSGERLPLFFDEAFARLDDRRTARFLRLLEQYAAGGGQCLLFTCHGREREMLRGEDMLTVRL